MAMNFSCAPCPRLAQLLFRLLPLLLGTTIFAQAPDVRVELAAKKVVTTEGRESLVPADKAKPGDIIQYEAVYRNDGKAAAKNVAATVPVPAGLALIEKSDKPSAELASLDGKNFSAVPLMRDVKNQAGVVEKKPVPLAEYRAVRWNLPELAPGKTATVALRAQVLTNTPAK
jgi:uncharacterized repeat protein (TIGR01451 family)